MKRLKRSILFTEILGLLAIPFMLMAMLALTDIYHGEADVRAEWWMVRILFLLFGLFIVSTFLTLRQVRKKIGSKSE